MRRGEEELVGLSGQLSQLQSDIANCSNDKTLLLRLMRDLKLEISNAKSRLHQIEVSTSTLKREKVDHENLVGQLRAQQSPILIELRRLKTQCKEIMQERRRYLEALDRVQEEIDREREASDVIEEVLTRRALQELADLEKERDTLRAASIHAAKQAATLRQRLERWTRSNASYIQSLNRNLDVRRPITARN